MALTGKVAANKIVSQFISDFQNIVIQNVYDGTNPPISSEGIQCIPSEYLDRLSNIPEPSIGFTNNIIDAGSDNTNVSQITSNAPTIYESLVYVTKILCRIGTFNYERKRKVTANGATSYDNIVTMSGKAFFTESYSVGNGLYFPPTVDRGDVKIENIISAQSIIQLINQCFSFYNNAGHPVYNAVDIYCHSSCHSNCHSNCHNDCHSNSGGGSCYGNNHYYGGDIAGMCYDWAAAVPWGHN